MSTRSRKSSRTASREPSPEPLFEAYEPLSSAFDEVFRPDGKLRPGMSTVVRQLDRLGKKEFRNRQRLADGAFVKGGVTFSVYSNRKGTEKIFPFDLIPRVVASSDWEKLEAGLLQRVTALNAFLADIYGDQKILRDDRIPRDIVARSTGYVPQARGVKPRGGVHVHVAGIDLVRDAEGRFIVLEDNLRCPSGVSYVLENRMVMKRVFPGVFARSHVRSVREYPNRLRRALEELSPRPGRDAQVVVLTPGHFNSAYFEHSFLARSMGCALVHGSDLFVHRKRVFVKTTHGPSQVDVIYRRVDDEFLDPRVFREDSLLGVPGLYSAYVAGNVTLANGIGNGVADDKATYPFVPDMIRYYLGEEPKLGQVETLVCARDDERKRVLDNLESMVVKAVAESGGYGMLVGPRSTRAERADFARRIAARPRNYIAQPLVELSTCPTWTRSGVEPRRVDLRPYVVTGRSSWVLAGGLTRVALVKGSYVVNSSQGGGSKDTWVLEGGGT